MIELSSDAGIAVAGLVAIAAVAWGANLSVRSAANGPEWALAHLGRLRLVWPGLIGLGVVVMLALSPIWIGLAVIYVVATMWFLAASLLRNLHRIQNLDGFVDIGAERRAEILGRAKRYLIGGGAALGLVGAALLSFGIIGWVVIVLGVVLVGTALLLGDPDA